MLEPVLAPLFAHAALVPGETVLDIGCGRGASTLMAAAIVGPGGAVTAVDVASDLIDAASALPVATDAAPIEWIAADAQRTSLGKHRFAAVISRFGVMFFDDPVEAFANLRRATKPGGRLAVATWRPRDASEFQYAGSDAITAALRDAGHDVPTTDPAAGPYSFGVDAHVHDVLGRAGWRDVVVHPVEMPLMFAGPGASVDDAVDMAMGMPGVRSMIEPYGDGASEIAAAALRTVYASHHDGTGVKLLAAMTIITADT
jgi:SAM-dependent methyltransferase